MTRSEAYRLIGKLDKEKRRELSRRFRGWTFQVPPGDHVWWNEPVNARTPDFGRSQAEGYLREVAALFGEART